MGGGWEQDGGGGKEHGDSGNKGGWDGGKGHKDGYGKDHHFGGGKDHDGEENKGKGFKGDKGGFKGKKGDYDGGYKGGKKGGLTSSNYGVRGGFARRKAFDINAGVVKFLENWNLDSGKKTSLFPTLAAHPSAARDLVLPHLMSKQDHLRGGAGICTRQVYLFLAVYLFGPVTCCLRCSYALSQPIYALPSTENESPKTASFATTSPRRLRTRLHGTRPGGGFASATTTGR